MDMAITSSAFAHNGPIPKLYTCEGKDISPPLAWTGLPAGAKSLVLIVDDPDAPDPAAPRMTWVHWLLYNLPVDSTGLPEAVHSLPAGTLDGLNDWQRARATAVPVLPLVGTAISTSSTRSTSCCPT
jgi:Raf kinase inhibitor-like YbhB/YbcL family protein